MTQLIILMLLSYPASGVMNLVSSARIFKDLADLGYVIDVEKNRSLRQIEGSDNSLMAKFNSIPIMNMLSSITYGMNYLMNRDTVLTQLNNAGMLIEMSNAEKIYYSLKPNGLTAMILASMNKKDRDTLKKKENKNTRLTDEEVSVLEDQIIDAIESDEKEVVITKPESLNDYYDIEFDNETKTYVNKSPNSNVKVRTLSKYKK